MYIKLRNAALFNADAVSRRASLILFAELGVQKIILCSWVEVDLSFFDLFIYFCIFLRQRLNVALL